MFKYVILQKTILQFPIMEAELDKVSSSNINYLRTYTTGTDKLEAQNEEIKSDLSKMREMVKTVIASVEDLSQTLLCAYDARDKLTDQMAKDDRDYDQPMIDELKHDFNNFSALVDRVLEKSSKSSDLRDEKRRFQSRLFEIEKMFDEQQREQSRRMKKCRQLNDYVFDKINKINETNKGSVKPEAIQRKLELIDSIWKNVADRNEELEAAFAFNLDSNKLKQTHEGFKERVKERKQELNHSMEHATDVLENIKKFNPWHDQTSASLISNKKAWTEQQLTVKSLY